ncbi:MAG: ABC transporter permease subunit [Paracoccaceae bacterium]
MFIYGGLGNLAIDAVINSDLPSIQGIVILSAVIFTAVNLIVDLLCTVLIPRLRHG